MSEIKNYLLRDCLEANTEFSLYRAQRVDDGLLVIIKFLTNQPYDKAYRQLKQEYEIGKSILSNNILIGLGVDKNPDRPLLVMEDFKSISLKKINTFKNIDILSVIKIGLELTCVLEEFSNQRIVDISLDPSTILVNNELNQIKFISSQPVTLFTALQGPVKSPNIESLTRYLSPELLRRTENTYDVRSFIFFIGAVLYELITQKMPYSNRAATEYYAQNEIIKVITPDTYNPNCPENLSKVILQCIELDPRLRYNTMEKLKTDLHQCINQWNPKVHEDIDKSKKELAANLLYTQQYYENRVELRELQDAFDRTADGSCEFAFFTGDTELSKTNIIYEFHKTIVYNSGYLCLAEFNSNKKNSPFYGILSSLKYLAIQLNGENEDVVTRYKNDLVTLVSPYGELLSELLPDMKEFFLVEGSTPPKLGKATEQAITDALLKFLNYFSSIGVTIVMLLDNLQWADNYSIRFLHDFWAQDNLKKFLIITTFKKNELLAQGPVKSFIDKLKEGNERQVQFQLKKANVQEFITLLSNFFGVTEEEIEPLAEVMYTKAHGYPVIAIHLIKMYLQEKFIEYSPIKKGWNFDIANIDQYTSANNMSDLIFGRFNSLDKNTQELVKKASVIGIKFDVATLATVQNQTEQKTIQQLVPVLFNDLIQKRFDTYLFSSNPNKRVIGKSVFYTFVNVVAHRLIYSLLSKFEREDIHYQIANILFNRISETKKNEHTIEIAHHYNSSVGLIKDPKEKEKVVRFNLEAGIKLKGDGKFKEAIEYIRQGIDYLPENKWAKDYELTQTLYEGLSESQLLAGEVKESKKTFEIIFNKASSREEKLKLLMERISLYGQLNLYDDAFRTVVDAVKLFNVKFRDKPSKLRILLIYLKIKWALLFKNMEQLRKIPPAKNKDAYLLGAVYDSTMHICFASARTELSIYTTFKMMNLFLDFGTTEYTSMALASYATLLTTDMINSYERGKELGELSLEIGSRYPDAPQTIKAAIVYYLFVNRWFQPLRSTVPALRLWSHKAFEAGGNCDIYGVGAFVGLGAYSLLSGMHLQEFLKEIESNLKILQRYKTPSGLASLYGYKDFCLALMNGHAKDIAEKEEDKVIQNIIEKSTDPLIIFRTTSWNVAKLVIMKRYDAALKAGNKVQEYLTRFPNEATWNVYFFYYFFALIESIKTSSIKNTQQMKQLKDIEDKFSHWSSISPGNFMHRALLLKAEVLSIGAEQSNAAEYYEKALQAAEAGDFFHDEAFIYERAAEYYKIINKEKAIAYLKKAMEKYQQWGATTKVMFLGSEYSNINTMQKENIKITVPL